ncbi:MBL fold metallo-hydrolase [Streptacidiphilus rugosus]|uniref:MBL fold metallo-hydrolase n=1 Tax=Streptacidiphilus rugosus TaxID=405783 RepID=UPI00068EB764|nr:MBL fold metallo-hydrolase [Streptacidiphilus rugosus]
MAKETRAGRGRKRLGRRQGDDAAAGAGPDAAEQDAAQSDGWAGGQDITAAAQAAGTGAAGVSSAAADVRITVDVFTGPESAFFATSSLVHGPEHAVLVDTQLTRSAGRELAEWVAGKARTLTAIVITHPHPDHYFGTEEVLRLFPGTPVYADPAVIDAITRTGLAKVVQWQQVLGDDITSAPIVPGPLPADTLLVDGAELHVMALGQGDCAATSIVHVPGARTVVAGDVAFNGTHVWTADTTREERADWLASLETVRGLDPDRVVAGHRAPGQDDDAARVIAFTGDYLREFDAHLAEHPGDADALFAAVTETYGELTLPAILQIGAQENTAR